MRIRIVYSKADSLKYTGNLDLQKIWERLLRRANLPLAYSQGFHPQPRINQGCPLPLGFIGENEMVDIWLDFEQLNVQELIEKIHGSAPAGLTVHQVEVVPDSAPSLPTQIVAADYHAILLQAVDLDNLHKQVEELLTTEKFLRERRGKKYDLRPLIEALTVEVNASQQNPFLFMRLAARSGATGRPDEVLSALGMDPFAARFVRTKLITTLPTTLEPIQTI
jgi:radical SAM-linked protein